MERKYIILIMFFLICIGISFAVFRIETIRIKKYLKKEISKVVKDSCDLKVKFKRRQLFEVCNNEIPDFEENYIDCA